MSAVTPDQEKCLLIARWRRLLARFCDADTVERASPGTKAAGKALAARYRLVAAAAMEAAREPIEAAIFMVPLLVPIIYFSIASFVWLYQYASQRGKKGCTALILVLLTGWPISLRWWLWLS